MKRGRNSSFELLRIICILMIVALHIVMIHQNDNQFETNVSRLVHSFCICAVNVFVLISGYFGIHFKIERVFKLDAQTWFYAVGSLLFLTFIGAHSFTAKDLRIFFPVLTKQYWFITVYVVLYFLSPWLNLFFERLSKQEMGAFLSLSFCCFYVWPTLCYLTGSPQLVLDAGYGIVNFVCLYLFGRFIYKYGFLKNVKKSSLMIGYVISSLTLFFIMIILRRLVGFEVSGLWSYNTIFVLIEAVFLFLFLSGSPLLRKP